MLDWLIRGAQVLDGTGADADLCLFSPENIRENGAYTAPRQLASGMDAVFVAGVPEIMDGQFTGETRGRVLRAH